MERERDESGKYTKQLTDEKVLDAFGQEGNIEVLAAQNVADRIGCTRQAADKRLRELAEEGKVNKIEFGRRSVAWTLADNRRMRKVE